MLTPIDRVLERLDRVTSQGDGYMARCPSHDDQEPSLSLSEGSDGRVLLKCHAGCSFDQITGSLGLRARELWPDSGRSSEGGCRLHELAAKIQIPIETLRSFGLSDSTYRDLPSVKIPYRGTDGTELRAKHRLKLSGAQKYAYGPGKGSHVYGLWQPVPVEDALVITEGESDAWALWSEGIPAIALPGATNLKPLTRSSLGSAKRVWVAGDNDEAGQKFNQSVVDRLTSWGVKVHPVAIPEGVNDLAEWRAKANGSFKTEFRTSLKSSAVGAKAKDESFVKLSSAESKPKTFVVDPYIPRGYLTILSGKPGTGKSMITCALAAGVTVGADIQGHPVAKGRVLMISAEDDPGEIKQRVERCGGDTEKIVVFRFSQDSITLDDEGLARISNAITEHKPDLVILDPVVFFLDSRTDMNRANQVRSELWPLKQIADREQIGVLLVAHQPKGGQSWVMGSTDFEAIIRSGLGTTFDPEAPGESGRYVMTHFKQNLTREAPTLRYEIRSWPEDPKQPEFLWAGESSYSSRDLEDMDYEEAMEVAQVADNMKKRVAGDVPYKQLRNEYRGEGHSNRVIRKAMRIAGLEIISRGMGSLTESVVRFRDPT